MKKVMFLLSLLALISCSKDVADEIIGSEESNNAANSTLQIRTRTGSEDATISYPVQVYVFQEDECRAVQTIGDEGQTLNIELTEGMYSVYAIGGASSIDYNLPTKDNATTTTVITLKDGKALTDLMAAKANVTLVDAGNYLYTTAAGAIYYRALSIDSEGNEGFGANARVRPLVTVTIAKE